MCPDANVGDTGEINGTTFTKRTGFELDGLVDLEDWTAIETVVQVMSLPFPLCLLRRVILMEILVRGMFLLLQAYRGSLDMRLLMEILVRGMFLLSRI